MPDTTDPYETLGVAEDASAKEIKAAYRKLAQQYHPDRNAGDAAAEERFKEVQSAYDTLGDETKRKAYDRARRDPYGGRFEGTPFGGGEPGGGRFYRAPDGTYVRVDATGAGPGFDGDAFTFGSGGGGGLGGIFDQFFGGAAGGGPEPSYRGGRDVESSVRLSFEDALEGGPRELRTPSGETVRVTVPKGVRDGFKIKLAGKGEPSPSLGAPGDLYLTFRVTPDARFSREGDDLVTSETISAVEAMLGTTREVKTAYGRTVRLKVKPGTQPGARLRVKGQGVETASSKGDLYVVLEVEVPILEDEAAQGLRAWADKAGVA